MILFGTNVAPVAQMCLAQENVAFLSEYPSYMTGPWEPLKYRPGKFRANKIGGCGADLSLFLTLAPGFSTF